MQPSRAHFVDRDYQNWIPRSREACTRESEIAVIFEKIRPNPAQDGGTVDQGRQKGGHTNAFFPVIAYRANEVPLAERDCLQSGQSPTAAGIAQAIRSGLLTSLQQRLVKTAGRLLKHARYCWLMLAESHLTRWLFAATPGKIAALPSPAG